MSTYSKNTAQAVAEAEQWAKESAGRMLSTYVSMVDRSREGTYDAQQLAKDVATLTAGAQQDAARVVTTWSRLLTGLLK